MALSTWRSAGSLAAAACIGLALAPAVPGRRAAGSHDLARSARATSPAWVAAYDTPARRRLIGAHMPEIATDWAGYVATRRSPYGSISAEFRVPGLRCSHANGIASPWVGMDGDSNDRVEQIGVDLVCRHGHAGYEPWWEMFPGPAHYFTGPIAAGDLIVASVRYTGTAGHPNRWRLSEEDCGAAGCQDGRRWAVALTERFRAGRKSAEAIVEAIGPSRIGVAPLPHFRRIAFSAVRGTCADAGHPSQCGGTARYLTGLGRIAKESVFRGQQRLTRESGLDRRSGFTVTWVHG